ncbi:hypothetical protein [Pseudonocardia sp. ICBG601]|uniref:hypothetical protein n=1 Tax=Pseudonocardia sp. ICBG601 TaxID=2846759 RepID=UPI001CF6117B|nr:hypothetical protein [Pseudonocardia sp. ICBG601]
MGLGADGGPAVRQLVATLETDGRRASCRFERPRSAAVLDTAAEVVLTPQSPPAAAQQRAGTVPAG